MSGHKKIAWESWNAKVDLLSSVEPIQNLEDQEYDSEQLSQFPIDGSFILEQQKILYIGNTTIPLIINIFFFIKYK